MTNSNDNGKQEPRMDKVEEAKWRLKNGYYNTPEVLKEALEKLLDSLD